MSELDDLLKEFAVIGFSKLTKVRKIRVLEVLEYYDGDKLLLEEVVDVILDEPIS